VLRDWRARHGVEPEVCFQQVAIPGREAAIDFTHATDLGVTIASDPFPHLLFEFVLGYSHWTWIHAHAVEVRYRDQIVQTMPRLHGEDEHRIDYRHVIGWLVRKPGAFARYRYREDLYPSVTFRRAYDAWLRTHGDRTDVEYLRIVQLAVTVGEARVGAVLADDPRSGGGLDYVQVQAQVAADPDGARDPHSGAGHRRL
jgi:hypothetical protein